MNLIVSHEPTFWSDTDTVKGLDDDPVYKFKVDFCNRNKIVVWRFHDHLHARRPDMIWTGLVRTLGWDSDETAPNAHRYVLPPTTLGALAADVQRRLKVRALRVVGDPAAKVSTVVLGVGYNIPRVTPDVDVVVGGESVETGSALDGASYITDGALLGRSKGQIILGHAISEEPGMEDCANWLRTFITEVPVQFIRAGEPFWVPK
jgi:putative NIF3 family GTP cyclohydrolase 1 type 2